MDEATLTRLQAEKDDLEAKILALVSFLDSMSSAYVTPYERDLMKLQAKYMAGYYQVLKQRLDIHLNPSKTESMH